MQATVSDGGICPTMIPPSPLPPDDSTCWQWWTPPSDGVLPPGTPAPPSGCDYQPCQDAVCACDDYCCNVAWDLSCRGYFVDADDGTENNYFVPGCSAKLLCCEPESAYPDPPIGGAMPPNAVAVEIVTSTETSFQCTPGTAGCCETMIPPSYLPPDDSTCWQWWDPPANGVTVPGSSPTPKGCNYKPCQDAVCACDSYCCETAWDLSCRGYEGAQGDSTENNYFVDNCSAKILCCEPESAYPDPPVGGATASVATPVAAPVAIGTDTSSQCTPGSPGCCETLIPPSYFPPVDSTCWLWWTPPADGVITSGMAPPPKGCDYTPCQDAVCACDSYCCNTAWDESCRGYEGAQGDFTENNYFVDNCSAKLLCCEDQITAPIPKITPMVAPTIVIPVPAPFSATYPIQVSQPAGPVTVSVTKIVETGDTSVTTKVIEVPVAAPIAPKIIEVPVTSSVTTNVIEVPIAGATTIKKVPIPVPVVQVIKPVPVPVPLSPKIIPVPVPVPLPPKIIPVPVPFTQPVPKVIGVPVPVPVKVLKPVPVPVPVFVPVTPKIIPVPVPLPVIQTVPKVILVPVPVPVKVVQPVPVQVTPIAPKIIPVPVPVPVPVIQTVPKIVPVVKYVPVSAPSQTNIGITIDSVKVEGAEKPNSVNIGIPVTESTVVKKKKVVKASCDCPPLPEVSSTSSVIISSVESGKSKAGKSGKKSGKSGGKSGKSGSKSGSRRLSSPSSSSKSSSSKSSSSKSSSSKSSSSKSSKYTSSASVQEIIATSNSVGYFVLSEGCNCPCYCPTPKNIYVSSQSSGKSKSGKSKSGKSGSKSRRLTYSESTASHTMYAQSVYNNAKNTCVCDSVGTSTIHNTVYTSNGKSKSGKSKKSSSSSGSRRNRHV